MPTISVQISSLPERARLLTECLASVHSQTRPADDIVVGIDPYRLGEIGNHQRLLDATDSEWCAFLHSDDLWAPEHLETISQFMGNADVIVSRFTLVGRPVVSMERWHDDFGDLRFTNWISSPSCVVVRRSVFGRWCEPFEKYRWNDWANWVRLLDSGARFVDTHAETVTCRFGDWGNGSWHP